MSYGFTNGPRYIERIVDGVKTKIELTWDDMMLLEKQEWYSLAINAIENHCDDAESAMADLTEEDLLDVGKKIQNLTFSDNGSIEWDVLEEYGIVE